MFWLKPWFWSQVWARYTELRDKRKDQEEKRKIAKVFNRRYTYRKVWDSEGPEIKGVGCFGMRCPPGFAWMCPECNKIHFPTELSAFSGLQYPGCCSTPAGSRHEILPHYRKSS
jgi:hypothetical protein